MIPDVAFIRNVISNTDPIRIEHMAQNARSLTRQYFGGAVALYAPLYLSNYCDSGCRYCGFSQQQSVRREKLDTTGFHREMAVLSQCGIQNVLLLTGESRHHTPPSYIGEAVTVARQYFPAIGLEVYPLEEAEYRLLWEAGADGITLYQETYHRDRYHMLHPVGQKADYDYRFASPSRMARAGIRTINMGVLLGLWDPAEDLHALFTHLRTLEHDFPSVDFGLSFPRIIPINTSLDFVAISDIMFVQILCLARLLFPRISISISTREPAALRDHLVQIAVNRISAGSRTGVGGYAETHDQTPQFDVQDGRSLSEVVAMLKREGLDPVFTDWRGIQNKTDMPLIP